MSSPRGEVFLVSGANTGLGNKSVLEYSNHGPAAISLAVRNLGRTSQADGDIKASQPDLSSLSSQLSMLSRSSLQVRIACNILKRNAGITAAPQGLTKEAMDCSSEEIISQAQPSSPHRVTSLVPDAHRHARNSNIDTASLKTAGESLSVLGYSGKSKLARILSKRHLAGNRPVLMAVAIQPDVAGTNLTEGSARWFAG
ncbi:hypothetical protein BN1708_010178 [Verticillium longisporum]|uniref:Ketoreductase (KR) domain-containing protein n=1 Tax=Verticillium longisporum TaxID=100787 RepID=A0A0G4KP22_VERLO|nr:hypothetical protein BN1708_010178 [Verticillium longisporum]